MIELLVLAVAGAAGAFVHRLKDKTVPTWSADTIQACLIWACIGVLYSVLIEPIVSAVVTIPASADKRVNVVLKAAVLVLLGLVAGDAIQERLKGLLTRGLGKVPVILLALLPVLAGCSGLAGSYMDRMTPEQIAAAVKDKNLTMWCLVANTPYGRGVNVILNLDRQVLPPHSSITNGDACTITVTTGPKGTP